MTFEQLNNLEVWQQMPTITLDEMSAIKLMNRVDTKYVLSEELCMELLRRAVGEYSVQVIGDVRAARYETLYYDTPNWDMYTVHHNRKLTRQKIRTRTYIETLLSFVEVKNKTNRGRTKKRRTVIDREYFPDFKRSAEACEFMAQHSTYTLEELLPSLITRFERVTLVNHAHTERLTIDFNVRFDNLRTGRVLSPGVERMVIVELKQDGMCYSPMKQIMLDLRVKKLKVSKYCIGVVLTTPEVKSNRFKRKLRQVRKAISNENISNE